MLIQNSFGVVGGFRDSATVPASLLIENRQIVPEIESAYRFGDWRDRGDTGRVWL